MSTNELAELAELEVHHEQDEQSEMDNFAIAGADIKGPILVAQGLYPAEIKKVEWIHKGNTKPLIRVMSRITDGKFENKAVFSNFNVLEPDRVESFEVSERGIASLLKATGEEALIGNQLDRFVGKKVMVNVTISASPTTGEKFNGVSSYRPYNQD